MEWRHLDEDECAIKDASVEMFLKSLDLISTFHPELNAGQLLEIDRKMAVTKKLSFERWVEKSFQRRYREESRERSRFARERAWRTWREWLSLETTQQAFGPIIAIVLLSGVVGWSIGVANFSCPTFLVPSEQTGLR